MCNMFKDPADFEKLVCRLKIDTEPNPAHCKDLRRRMLRAFEETRQQPQKHVTPLSVFRRTIMRSPITKAAAAAVIVTAILLVYNFSGSENAAFAHVMRNIRSARTLTCQTVLTSPDRKPQVVKTMILEPHEMRVELADGSIWITNYSQGKTLLLDSKSRQAALSSTPERTLDLYDTFRDLRNVPDFTVKQLGRHTVDGTQAVGFRLTKQNDDNEIILWADAQTLRPIRIEHTMKDKNGRLVKSVTTKIVFDAKLNKSIFSLEIPEGYVHERADGQRAQSVNNMRKILLKCLMYAQDHQDQWPAGLQDLGAYGLTADDLKNPRYAGAETGYVYVRPKTSLSSSQAPSEVALYEKYKSWADGINVGFADAHVEFITKQSRFKRLLEESSRPR
jgi:prepilin-type processing-associated H-X9-DG protein